jgi:hypothetical protein
VKDRPEKKVISYERVTENLYNLAFGDWNEGRQRVDDSARNNNGDRDKVLMTVALLGFHMQNWEPFLRGRNYESFLALRK